MTDIFLGYFLPFALFFALTTCPKSENFKKMKKNTTGDIIILHKCTKDHDHMVYCFWNTARDRCNCYFSFWAIISPFTPQNENFKKKKKRKRKKHLEIPSFYTSVPKIMIKSYTIPEIWHVTDVILIFHFGLFFCLNGPKNRNFKRMKKKSGDNIILHLCTKNYD